MDPYFAAPIIINPTNETSEQTFLPNEGQNCQITLPVEGATVKVIHFHHVYYVKTQYVLAVNSFYKRSVVDLQILAFLQWTV